MKIIKSTDNTLVSNITDALILHIGDIFDSLEIRLGDVDYIMVDDKKAVISINKNNRFVMENDREGIEMLLAKRIISLRFSSSLSELLVDREIINLGLSEKLFYYYYVLLSSPREISNIEEFIQLNVPWISFYPHDKEYSQFLKEAIPNHRKEFESATKKLFGLLKKNLYTSKAINEAEEEWTKITK